MKELFIFLLIIAINFAKGENSCPEFDDPAVVVHLPHLDCTKFYKCSHGQAHEMDCPNGLHWNVEKDWCDWPAEANCNNNENINETPLNEEEPTNNECPQIDDPNQTIHLSHPDCSKFYACSNGVPIEMNCPAGLHWNIEKNWCDWPAEANCNNNENIDEPPVNDEPSNSECPSIDDPQNPVHLSHSDCSKFYSCSNGVPIEMNCPQGLHWNVEKDWCDWPAEANCNNNENINETPLNEIEPTNNECPQVDDPNQTIHLPHSDCSKFYSCSNGVPTEMNCPAGLHWNIEKNWCDWPAEANCNNNENIDEPPVNDEPANNECPQFDDPNQTTHLPHSDCSKFYSCSNGVPIEMNCPEGLHWNVEKDWCDWPAEANCNNNENISETPLNDDEESNNECSQFNDPNQTVLLPHSDCSKFYSCSNGVPIEMNCPEGLHWNVEKNSCDWQWEANCIGSENINSLPEIFQPLNGECPEFDDPQNPVHLPHADCSKFYSCSNSVPIEMNCPAGLHWNIEKDWCDWPAEANCVGGENINPLPENFQPLNGECPEFDDPQNPVHLPHADCSKFYSCSNGVPIEMNCPAGLHWNIEKDWCDWPAEASCVGGENINPLPENFQPLNGECPQSDDPQNPVHLPHADCSKFYSCSNGVPIEMNCPAGLHWNIEKDWCDWPAEANCVGGENINPLPENFQPLNGECPQSDDPQNPVHLPHSDCSKFYSCSNGVPIEMNCPAGLHWNIEKDWCDWPAEANCVGGENINPLPENFQPLNGECPQSDDPQNPVHLPHADCSKFYSCSNGVPIEMNCPAGLHWNIEKDWCDWQSEANCIGGENVNPLPENFQPLNGECPQLDDPQNPVHLPHSDCSKFFSCSNGVPIEMNCPVGLHWNIEKDWCDWQSEANCIENSV